MNVTEVMEVALGEKGVKADAGLAPDSPGAVQVVALCRHKVDGRVVHAGQHYWLAEDRARNAAARDVVHLFGKTVLDWWNAPGRVLSPFEGDREVVHSSVPSAGSLTILQGCGYDPGSAAYRYHSAVNQESKHTSAFVRFGDTNPHCSLRQYDGIKDAPALREALQTADVLHCHMNYYLATGSPEALPVHWKAGQWVVRHYHGSRMDGRSSLEHRVDALVRERAVQAGGGLLRLGARLTLCAEEGAGDLEWLPIPVPVSRYQRLRAEVGYTEYDGSRPFVIAHSPTKRAYKGTESFERAIDRVQNKGLSVQPLMIANKSHGDALKLKATADATFDSFWLGIQGSGLEAAAMGMPVIAGDVDVKALYEKHVGYCPYTFAGDETDLAQVIERLVVDAQWRSGEAKHVAAYTASLHDYPAVARRYETILAKHLGRPDVITTADVMPELVALSQEMGLYDIEPTPNAAQLRRRRRRKSA